MAKKVREVALNSREARKKLKTQAKPYYRAVDNGLHLGYRKGKTGGKWVLRRYVGGEDYVVETFATADDKQDADGAEFLTFYQAQNRAREIAKQTRQPAEGEEAGKFTVGRALDQYLARLESEHSKSVKDARNRADRLIRPALGEVEVSKLTREQITKWRNQIAEAPRMVRGKKDMPARALPAPQTDEEQRRRRSSANRTLTVLRAALNQAFRDGKTNSDVAWRAAKPFREVEAARIHYFSVEEARRLVNAAQGQFRALVNAALFTGCRYGELTRLRVADFNSDAGTVFVGKSKSGKARHVVLSGEGQQFFQSLALGRASDDLLLTTAAGDAWGSSHQLRPMREACVAARLKPVGFHTLRHTYASLLAMAGAPLNVIAQNLGHANSRMVEKHYAHLAPSYLASTIRQFAPTLGTVPASNISVVAHAKGPQ